MDENPSHTESTYVSRVAVKAPPFWKNNPRIWFAQLEAQFVIAHITEDSTKFNHVVAAIESDILNSVQDLILDPPTTDKYSELKKRLIEIHSQSETSKIRTLLQGLELGDQRPSHLLSRMRELSGKHFSDEILKSLWLSRLPSNIQPILAASTETLPLLATMADKIAELVQPANINAIQPPQNVPSPLEAQVAVLTQQLSELTASVKLLHARPQYSSRNTHPVTRRNRSRSTDQRQPNTPNSGMCYYHIRFGANARKCTTPCSFSISGN